MRVFRIWLAIALLGAALPVAADTLELGNCTFNTITVETYAPGDFWCLAPIKVQNINACEAYTFTCSGSCKYKVKTRWGTYGRDGCKHHAGEMLFTRTKEISNANALLGLRPDNYDTYCECWYDSMHEALGH